MYTAHNEYNIYDTYITYTYIARKYCQYCTHWKINLECLTHWPGDLTSEAFLYIMISIIN